MYNEVITPIDFPDDSQYGVRSLSNIPHLEEVALFHILLNLNLMKKQRLLSERRECLCILITRV